MLKLATRFEVIDGRIQLYDAEDNKLEGNEARWGGDFYCYNNNLTTLKGAPREVGGRFCCYNNNLTSLEGAPKEVGGHFYCYNNNNLTSLEGAPKEVGGDFCCHNNKLTTLEGAPREVGGDFYCYNNNLTTLKGAPREVGGNFYCSNNKLTSLEGAPKEVGGSFYCIKNKLTSLEGAPKEFQHTLVLRRIEEARNTRGYTGADGILGRILSKRGKVIKLVTVGSRKTLYCVTDGEGNYSHGETIKQAREDLVYKIVAREDVEIPKKATGAEWVGIYRAVTGACSTGVKLFVESTGKSLGVVYTLEEVLVAVKGRYGYASFISRAKS